MTVLGAIAPLFLSGTLLACAYPVGRYPLAAPSDPSASVQYLDVEVAPVLENRGAKGWDLELQLEIAAQPGHSPWVDLSRVMLRTDGLRWLPCRAVDPETRAAIEPSPLRFQDVQLHSTTLVCEAIARPSRMIEVRIPATGAGGKGYLELSIDGLRSGRE